jgi:hypothetical protein
MVLFLGFATAIGTADFVCALLFATWIHVMSPPSIENAAFYFANTVLLVSLIGLPIAVLCGLLIGLPVHAAMVRREFRDLTSYLFAGTLCGSVVGVALLGLLLELPAGVLGGLACGAGGGFTAALIWWFMAVRDVSHETF